MKFENIVFVDPMLVGVSALRLTRNTNKGAKSMKICIEKLLIFVFIIFLSSCGVMNIPNDIKQKFVYCYDGKNTGIENWLDIQGYYRIGSITERSDTQKTYMYDEKGKFVPVPKIDTSYTNLMFYPDGIFVSGFRSYDQSIADYFLNIIKNMEKGKTDVFYKRYYWGVYKLVGDTIKVQCINHPDPLASTWMAHELWYKIEDRTQISFILSKPLYQSAETNVEKIRENNAVNKINGLPGSFISISTRPAGINCWVLKEKWFWCATESID